jgi:secondary thiamine-phosphate synthase enzyme
MLYGFTLSAQREDFYNITPQLREAIAKSGVDNGCAVIYCPHTTAGITINENADPDVVRDMLFGLREAYPDRPQFRHAEGNSLLPPVVTATPCTSKHRQSGQA